MSAARVSFYVLGGTAANTRLGYACRLLEKAYKVQNRIHTHTGDEHHVLLRGRLRLTQGDASVELGPG